MRHTDTANGKVMAAREALGLTHKYLDEWDKAAMELFTIPVIDNTVDSIFKAIYPMPEKDSKGSMKKWETKNDKLWDIYNGDTVGAGIRGTAYGVVNAALEQIDWFRAPRGGSADNIFAAAAGFDPVTNSNKNGIVKLVKSMATDKALVRV